MKTPLAGFDVADFIKELGEAGTKLVKGAELLAGIDEIDVGTAPKELVHEEDKLKLYRYRQPGKVTCGVPVLIVYALVNRQYMLDIQPDRSIVRDLLAHGLDVYIINWGYPTKADMYLGLDDYINGYLGLPRRRRPGRLRQGPGEPMGICQGGTFCMGCTPRSIPKRCGTS